MWVIFLCLLNGVNAVIAQELLDVYERKWVVTIAVVVGFLLGYLARITPTRG